MLGGIQDRWRPLRAELFPRVVLLDLSDSLLLRGQPLRGDRPAGPVWSAPVPAQTCRDGVPIAREALGDFIGDLLLEHSSPDAGLVLAIPQEASFWRVLEWPGGEEPEEPLEELLERAPDLGWPQPISECVLDLQPLPGAPGASLVVGAARQTVEAWIEVIAIAGGSLRHLIPAPACLATALEPRLQAAEPGELLALLQPDGRTTQLLVWRDGCPEFQRSLPLDPQALLPELEQALQFCRQRFRSPGLRLLLAEGLAWVPQLQERLPELALELFDPAPWGSLALQGLALLELAR